MAVPLLSGPIPNLDGTGRSSKPLGDGLIRFDHQMARGSYLRMTQPACSQVLGRRRGEH